MAMPPDSIRYLLRAILRRIGGGVLGDVDIEEALDELEDLVESERQREWSRAVRRWKMLSRVR